MNKWCSGSAQPWQALGLKKGVHCAHTRSIGMLHHLFAPVSHLQTCHLSFFPCSVNTAEQDTARASLLWQLPVFASNNKALQCVHHLKNRTKTKKRGAQCTDARGENSVSTGSQFNDFLRHHPHFKLPLTASSLTRKDRSHLPLQHP